MEKKQTAVEWLQSRVLYMASSSQKDDLIKLFDQAKEMENEQSKQKQNDAYKKGFNDGIKYERIRL